MSPVHLLGSPSIVHNRDLIPYALIPSCHTPNFFVILQTKQLILKYNISALKKLNVEELDLCKKRTRKTCYKEYILY